jgi:FdhE protein
MHPKPTSALDALTRARPEWAPWLSVVDETLRENATRKWDRAVPAEPERDASPSSNAPLLAGCSVSVQTNPLRRLVLRLIRVAARGGTTKMKTLEALQDSNLDVLSLFTASLCQDSGRIVAIADRYGTDSDALQAVVGLIPVPFLQACNRQWAAVIRQDWVEGYCPVCGSWPAFAEVLGIERARHFRCGRCGGGWHAQALSCPYCATNDHDELVTLVPEKEDTHSVIEACRHCHGYVKTFTRLQGCDPEAVMIEDLAHAALDVAAFAEGFVRPPGAGYSLNVNVSDGGAARRFFAWNA